MHRLHISVLYGCYGGCFFVCGTNMMYGFYEFCMWYMYGVGSMFPVSSVFCLCVVCDICMVCVCGICDHALWLICSMCRSDVYVSVVNMWCMCCVCIVCDAC